MTAICSEYIDSMTFGRYSSDIAAKSAIRIGVLKVNNAHNRAQSGFFMRNALSHLSMVGWAGASSEAPGSLLTGTPTLFSSSPVIGVAGGEFKDSNNEAATMATIPAIPAPEIRIIDGHAVTTSLAVADYFTKRHADVIRKIELLECSPEFSQRNFARAEYTDDQGKKRPAYQITRDGFAFLAMGFTGKRAAQFKEAYITAFNAMESGLHTKMLRGELSNADYNIDAVYINLKVVSKAWDESLRPMLLAAQSPLATSLHDRIKDALFCTYLVKQNIGGAK
ncbi:MAG: Rha family transcriptional regulator [Plesiomonas shigelloides]